MFDNGKGEREIAICNSACLVQTFFQRGGFLKLPWRWRGGGHFLTINKHKTQMFWGEGKTCRGKVAPTRATPGIQHCLAANQSAHVNICTQKICECQSIRNFFFYNVNWPI